MRAAWMILALAACKPVTTVPYAPGSDVDAVALIAVADGQFIGATAFQASDQPLPYLVDDETTTLLIGLGRDQLGGEAGLQALLGEVPELAADCAPSLPQPRLLRTLVQHQVLETAIQPPPLTTKSWQTSCPDEATRTLYLAAPELCVSPSCAPVLTPLGSCRYSVDLQACGLGQPELTIDPLGQLCVQLDPSRFECHPQAPGVLCSAGPACPVELQTFTPDQPPLFDTAVAQVGPTPSDSLITYINHASTFQRGILRGLLVFDDTVVVARRPEVRDMAVGCVPEQPKSSFLFVDLETLAVTASVTAERCVYHLVQDQGKILAPYFEQGHWRVGRFSHSGQLEASAEVPGADAYLPSPFEVVAVVALPQSGRLVVVWGASTSSVNGGAVAILSLSDLSTERFLPIPSRLQPSFAYASGDDGVLVIAGRDQRVYWVDASLGNITQEVTVRTEFLPNATLMSGFAEQDTAYVVANEFLYRAERSGPVTRTILHTPEPLLFALAPWPPAPQLFLTIAVGPVDRAGVRPTSAHLYDPAQEVFLPGRWPVAERPVTLLQSDAKGRLWLLVPELAQLVRLTPR